MYVVLSLTTLISELLPDVPLSGVLLLGTDPVSFSFVLTLGSRSTKSTGLDSVIVPVVVRATISVVR